MNGRVYDPLAGRFLSRDPIIDGFDNSQGSNGYGYVWNNPLNRTDPSGFEGVETVPKKCKVDKCGESRYEFRGAGAYTSCFGNCGGGYWNSPRIYTTSAPERSETGGETYHSVQGTDFFLGKPSPETHIGTFKPGQGFESSENPNLDYGAPRFTALNMRALHESLGNRIGSTSGRQFSGGESGAAAPTSNQSQRSSMADYVYQGAKVGGGAGLAVAEYVGLRYMATQAALHLARHGGMYAVISMVEALGSAGFVFGPVGLVVGATIGVVAGVAIYYVLE